MTSLNDLSDLLATLEREAEKQDETVKRFAATLSELPRDVRVALGDDALPELEVTPRVLRSTPNPWALRA